MFVQIIVQIWLRMLAQFHTGIAHALGTYRY